MSMRAAGLSGAFDRRRLLRRSAGLCALLATILVGGCGVFGGDKDEDPPAPLPDFKTTLRIREVWAAGIGGSSEFLRLALAPASDGSRLYAAAHDGEIVAFEAGRGARLWRTNTKLPLSAGPAVDGKVVVVGTSDGEVVALNADDGKQIWRKSVSSEVLAAPALAGNLVFVRTVDGKLTALGIDDGNQAWFVQQAVPRLSVRGTAAPVVIKNLVLCGFDNGRVAAYQLTDGSLAWESLLDPPGGRNEVERLADVNAAVRAIGDDLYAVGYQGRLAALALESGQVLWSQDIPSHTGLAVDLTNLYVSGSTSELVALTRQTGAELWRHELLKNRDITAPAAYQGSVVVGDFEGYVHWFDAATGKPQARAHADGQRITSQPLVVNDMLYVQTDSGKLVAYQQVPK